MCSSDKSSTVAALDGAAAAALAAVEELAAAGAARPVADETVQRLVLAAVRLFAHKVDSENRVFHAVPAASTVSATEVAVTVTALMREVDLNMFDLAMWAGRTAPDRES